jgi:hypothetical protein
MMMMMMMMMRRNLIAEVISADDINESGIEQWGNDAETRTDTGQISLHSSPSISVRYFTTVSTGTE